MIKITHTGPKKGKISKAIEVPCFEFAQGKYKLYAFVLDAKTAWSIFSISRMTEDDENDEDFDYQRILSPARLSNITRYITTGKPIPNSILVSLDKADYVAHTKTLKIPKGTDVAWVIDGQHRLAGAFQASQNKHNISLLVVAFIGLTEKEQVEQFITINDEARGVPRSILLELNRRLSFAKTEKEISEDRAGDIANALRRDPESIFFNKPLLKVLRLAKYLLRILFAKLLRSFILLRVFLEHDPLLSKQKLSTITFPIPRCLSWRMAKSG